MKRILEFFEKLKESDLTLDDLKKALNFVEVLGGVGKSFKKLVFMAIETMKGNFSLTPLEWTTIVGTVAYVISPVDVIPDIVPVLGFSDDIALVTWAITVLADALKRFDEKFSTNY